MQAEPWTPRTALFDDALVTRIAALARDWALNWFGPDKRVEARVAAGASLPGARDARSWRSGSLVLSLESRAPLGWWMLGLQTGAQAIKPADEALLGELSACAADDFMRRACALFGGNGAIERNVADRHNRDDIVWSISAGAATNVMHLIAPPALAAKARLALMPRFSSNTPLADRRDAISRQAIRVGAMVGVGRMALSEMRTLTIGDVVVLDHGPGDAVALTINGAAQHDTPCELRRQGARLGLRLADKPTFSDQGQTR